MSSTGEHEGKEEVYGPDDCGYDQNGSDNTEYRAFGYDEYTTAEEDDAEFDESIS